MINVDGAPILVADKLSVSFGGVRAVDGLSVNIYRGHVTGLVGPNGAGKSTVLNLLSGFYTLDEGRVSLENERGEMCDITSQGVHSRALAGLGRTFQTPRLFPQLTTLENVVAGQCARRELTGFRGLVPTKDVRSRSARETRESMEILSRFGLTSKASMRPDELSLGEQRLVEIARAIATNCSALMLDEPFAGLADSERAELVGTLREVLAGGEGILLVEHNLDVVRQLASELVVMREGSELTRGTAEDALRDPAVIEAFLGSDVNGDEGHCQQQMQ